MQPINYNWLEGTRLIIVDSSLFPVGGCHGSRHRIHMGHKGHDLDQFQIPDRLPSKRAPPIRHCTLPSSINHPTKPSPKLLIRLIYWLHFCHCTYTTCLNFRSVESVVSKPVALEFVLVRRIWLLMLSRLPLLPQGDMTVDVLSASSCLR